MFTLSIFLYHGPIFPICTNSLIFHTELIFVFAKFVILCYRCFFSNERKYVRRNVAATVACDEPICCGVMFLWKNVKRE